MNWIGRLIQCEVSKNDTVLELGCGIMQTTMDTCSFYPPTKLRCKKYVGVDGFQEYVDFLNKRGDVEVIKWDLTVLPLPFADKSFDVVLLIDVLEHMPSMNGADALCVEAIRIARKKVFAFTPAFFCDNKCSIVDKAPFPYNNFKGNILQEHHILIDSSLFRGYGFKVKLLIGSVGNSFYSVYTFQPYSLRNIYNLFKRHYRFILENIRVKLYFLRNNLRILYVRVFHNSETSKTHWEILAKVNPYTAVCTSVKTQAEINNVTDSVVLQVDYKGKDVLDVCCGVGRIANFIAKDVKSYTGVDWSKNMINTARTNYKEVGNTKFIVSDGTLNCLPDNSFDVAICELAFQHMAKTTQEQYILEGYRVLRKGGVFVAQLPRKDFYEKFPEYRGRGYDLEEAKLIFPKYSKIVHVEGYNHNYAYYLIKAYKEN